MDTNDITACWPAKWRDDFEYENSLLADEGEELLTPDEFLQCRYDDWLEATDTLLIARAQRHHEVFEDMMRRAFQQGLWTMENGDEAIGTDLEGWRKQCVDAARSIADLAYPKPDVKP
jgi:hypothetical protein